MDEATRGRRAHNGTDVRTSGVSGDHSKTFLATAGELLAASLDYATTLSNVARLAVPRLCEWCVIYVVEGDQIHQMGAAHADPLTYMQLCERHRGVADLSAENPVRTVLRTGEPVFLPDIGDEALRTYCVSDEQFHFVRDLLGLRQSFIVPMVCRERTLGAICLQRTGQRRFRDAELTLAEDLARLAAFSVDNARLYREAQEAVLLRDEMVSMASHDIRSPLTVLLAQVQYTLIALRRGAAPTPEQMERSLTEAERQIKRIAKLLDGLLDLSRISAGRFELRREEIDLSALVREVVGRMGQELAREGAEVALSADERVLGHWDRLRVEQVVTNLLSNAVKYGEGRPIEIAVRAEGPLAFVSVRDHGMGIAPEDQERIFERFERARGASACRGIGLGLHIVRRLLVAMGGSIAVASCPGAGATFTASLPLLS